MIEQLLIAKSWHKKQSYVADSKKVPDVEIHEMDLLNSEVLQQMVSQDYLNSDNRSESASDMELDTNMNSEIDELYTSFLQESMQESTLNLRKHKAKEIPVIYIPLSSQLRKHIRKNY